MTLPDAPRPPAAEHEHTFTFLRQEEAGGYRGEAWRREDVFFCAVCLEYKRVEVWRGRPSF